tara:strand:+ start:436 stop:612 length:177 start_codon:yes stop_codon:yes gene_type:complete
MHRAKFFRSKRKAHLPVWPVIHGDGQLLVDALSKQISRRHHQEAVKLAALTLWVLFMQ